MNPVKKFRLKQDWSQTELARWIGSSQTSISEMERCRDYDLSGRSAMRLIVLANAVGDRLGLSDIYPGYFRAERHRNWCRWLVDKGVTDTAGAVRYLPIYSSITGPAPKEFNAWFAGQVALGNLTEADMRPARMAWESAVANGGRKGFKS